MQFDEFIAEPCVTGAVSLVDPTTCLVEPPPSVDDRCADPAFYEVNPDICAGYPRLILKLEFVIIPSGGTVQYHTYLRTNGNEIELTNGLHYTTTNPSIAVIQATDGLLTGVSSGVTTVGVTWQNLSAHAQVQVVETCSALEVDYCLLIDNSKSAGASFSGQFGSRLDYAKEIARQFAVSANYSKDKVAVAYFNEGGTIVLEAGHTLSEILTAIEGITQTTARTDLAAGLQVAMGYLDTLSGTEVLVIFSDGENNEGADPVALATSWKEQGNIISVVGLRSWGTYFDLLYRIATNGFFLSAYPATQQTVIDNLKGLKNFVCSSDCVPVSGTYPIAKLNYTGFSNWDVVRSSVDLIGLDKWDLLPGNGLYVDLAGTPTVSSPVSSPGAIRTKASFVFTSGHQYRLRINVAGNQRFEGFDEPVHLKIATDDDLTIFLDELVTPTSFDMPFTTYTFLFTPGSTASCKLLIELQESGGGSNNSVGPLIDVVDLQDLTTAGGVLYDDFDNENVQTIPPQYSYYCSSFSAVEQRADPTPPPTIE